MMNQGPGPTKRKKTNSDMPRKPKDQCADTGKCKVESSPKNSAKENQKSFIKNRPKMQDDSDDDDYVRAKDPSKYEIGGKMNKMNPKGKFSTNSKGNRHVYGSDWKDR